MTQVMVFIPAAVMLVLLLAIYSAIIAGLAWLIRRWRVTHQYAVFLSLLIFGLVTGILVVWLWPLDSSILPNIFGVWLGDWIYRQAIAWMGNPYSAQAHATIPWVFQIPHVYVIASTGLCASVGLVLQLIWALAQATRLSQLKSHDSFNHGI